MQKKAVVSNVCFFQTQPYLGKFLNLVGIQVELLQGSLKTEDLLGHLLKAAVGIVQHWDHLLLTTETTTRHQPANQLPLSGHFQTLNCERERKKREGIFESSLKVGICAIHIAFFLSWRFGLLHDKLIYTCVSKMMSDTLPRKSKKEKPWKMYRCVDVEMVLLTRLSIKRPLDLKPAHQQRHHLRYGLFYRAVTL